MINMKKLFLAIILAMAALTAYAQKTTVSYDFLDSEGQRFIQTSPIVAVKPSKSKFPISISLDYYEGIPGNYFLMLYGRYPLTESTILTLILEDGDKIQLNPYSLNVIEDKLGLVTSKTVYTQYFPLPDSQMKKILNGNIKEISVDIDGAVHCKKYSTKEVSMWLKHNYQDIKNITE